LRAVNGTGECKDCPKTCDAATQELEDEIDKVPPRLLLTLCKIPWVCDDLPSIHGDLRNAMWNAVDLCLKQPLTKQIGFARAVGAADDVLAGISLASSDSSVLEITDDGGDTFSLEKRRAGPVEIQMVGWSHSGAVAAVTTRMVLRQIVPALPLFGVVALGAALAAAGMAGIRRRRLS
jgi:hypothetical protein